jgi:hypothetical protein
MSHRCSIRLAAEAQKHTWLALLPTLEELLPVSFSFSPDQTLETAGEILTEGTHAVEKDIGASVSTFKVPHEETASGKDGLSEIAVQFLDEPNVPFPYRGRSLRTKALVPNILRLTASEKPLATCAQGPVWAYSERGEIKHFRSAFSLPVIQAQAGLQDVLGGHRFLEVLPLLCWLQTMCSSISYEGPPLRACFVFDDPNLHWPRYGFVDYQKLVIQAERENYHVSFATIPLDTWFTHRETAAIFRDHPSRLSLAIHGNNHTKRELAQVYTMKERVFLVRQAIKRIERLESRIGFAVSRVMVPPHGACSEEMLAALANHGFEAACISHGSLRAHNSNKAWTKNLGFLPSERIEGCPVIPRWGLSGDLTNTILLAAFLKQAIILRGHHQDLRDGIELLDNWARLINGLGNVAWSNLTDLSRSNYQWRVAGANCQLKPLGRKGTCSLPTEVTRLAVDGFTSSPSEGWKIQVPNGPVLKASPGKYISLPPRKDPAISYEIAPSGQTSVGRISGSTPPVALVRRLLTEARDRFFSFLQ